MKILTLILGCFVCLHTLAYQAEFPSFPSKQVLDKADLLNDKQEKHLAQKVAQLEQETSMQIRLVTVPSVTPYPTASEYTIDLYQHWKLGDRDKHNGLLILVTQQIGKKSTDMRDYCRIMTGWGTMIVIPDSIVVNDIKRNHMIPNLPHQPFRAFDESLDRIIPIIKQWQKDHPRDNTVKPDKEMVEQKPSANVEVDTNDTSIPIPIAVMIIVGALLGGVVLIGALSKSNNPYTQSTSSYNYNNSAAPKKKDNKKSNDSGCSGGACGGGSSGCGGSGCGGGGCGGCGGCGG